jgi:HAD superfamily hydrolase (TIGR01450 family)
MVSGAIVDLDGTVYRGEELLPGAAAGIEALRGAGCRLCFFSNNPTKDGAAYVDRLREMGIDAREGEACSAGVATAAYLREHHPDDPVLLVGDEGLAEQLRAAGLTLTDEPDEAEVLVGSWTNEFDYEDMMAALDAVDDDTVFLGSDPDRAVPYSDGRLIPGSGAVVGALARTVGREPDAICGKPSAYARDLALERLGVPADECLVVGDRLDTDLLLGQRAGMTTVLVLTGVSSRADVADSDVDPDYVLENLGGIERVLEDRGVTL